MCAHSLSEGLRGLFQFGTLIQFFLFSDYIITPKIAVFGVSRMQEKPCKYGAFRAFGNSKKRPKKGQKNCVIQGACTNI